MTIIKHITRLINRLMNPLRRDKQHRRLMEAVTATRRAHGRVNDAQRALTAHLHEMLKREIKSK